MSATRQRPSGLVLRNGRTADGARLDVRIAGARIAALDGVAAPGDRQVDLRGDRILPGLINAHDHLQLNSLPRLKYRDGYANASQWIDDIRPRLRRDPLLVANDAVPRAERLLSGGMKNLLSGVTTVAHHDPFYPSLRAAVFPVRVVADYGWSHSLALDGELAVREACRRTPPGWPWIIHAAEGRDAAAMREFDTLEALGCVGANTVLVHGVGLSVAQQHRLAAAGAGLVWCPSSNLHLFGCTVDIRELLGQRRVALGSDSRLTGMPDLLAELGVAREVADLDERELERMVTRDAARLLRLPDRGELRVGAAADLLVLPQGLMLSRAARADVRLVLLGGVARYADPDYAEAFAGDADEVRVDGRRKFLDRALVRRLRRARTQEAGLSLELAPRAPHAQVPGDALRSRQATP